MLEKLLGMSIGVSLSDLGGLAALTSIIVQVLKQIIPKKFPTQALTIIVAILISTFAVIMFSGLMIKTVCIGILTGFVVAFIAMEGFDSLKNIWNRFIITTPSLEDIENVQEENASEEVENGGEIDNG